MYVYRNVNFALVRRLMSGNLMTYGEGPSSGIKGSGGIAIGQGSWREVSVEDGRGDKGRSHCAADPRQVRTGKFVRTPRWEKQWQ